VGFAAITLCATSQRVFIVVYFVIDSVRKLLDTFSYSYRKCPFFVRILPKTKYSEDETMTSHLHIHCLDNTTAFASFSEQLTKQPNNS
jgi:hypothetical protein